VKLEASTIESTGTLCPPRITIGPRLLRLRSDEQLVVLFRAGHDEAFQVIHDRYHKRLEAYARQMLPCGYDVEDVLQDAFVRAYRALLVDERQLALRAWLFRIVHNRCIDEMRRATPTPSEELADLPSHTDDPVVRIDARESLRRLVADIRRLPEQQRSALLLRELSGISYTELAVVLDTTVPAVKSLLVRARMELARASAARDTACSEIQEELTLAHDQGVRAGPTVRRHLRDCPACRSYRGQICLVKKRLAALSPLGPGAALARLIGWPGSGATGTGGAASGTALSTGGVASGAALGTNHVAALLAAAIASAGGGVGLQHLIASGNPAPRHAAPVHRAHGHARAATGASAPSGASSTAEPGSGVPVANRIDAGRHLAAAGSYGGFALRRTAGGPSGSPGLPSGSAVDTTTSGNTPSLPSGSTGTSTDPGSATGPPPQTRTGPPADPSTGAPGTDVGGTASGPPPVYAAGSPGSTSSGGTDGTGTDGSGTGTPGTTDPGTTTTQAGDGSTGTGPTPPSDTTSSGSTS
jgi:RNA polymerase sigma factor (sigma-70 family)